MQNSPKGYQLIEDDFTSEIVRSYPNEQMASAVLYWLVALLRQEPLLASLPIDIELIVANYVGKYPCIGVHYHQVDFDVDQVEPLILSLMRSYRENRSFGEFHQYLVSHQEEVSAFRKQFDDYASPNDAVW